MKRLGTCAALTAFLALATMQVARAEFGRFVRITKVEMPDTRFHLSELEVFIDGIVHA
ncbi:MAG: hypothetical protein IID44_03775 [Planctomycetes bacterium]|nr:hypothetical protein [Planctomycetota bacterium]